MIECTHEGCTKLTRMGTCYPHKEKCKVEGCNKVIVNKGGKWLLVCAGKYFVLDFVSSLAVAYAFIFSSFLEYPIFSSVC